MKTILQVVIDHRPVAERSLEESAEAMKDMVRRAIQAKAQCWVENAFVESVSVKQAVEKC